MWLSCSKLFKISHLVWNEKDIVMSQYGSLEWNEREREKHFRQIKMS